MWTEPRFVQYDRLITGVAAVFAVLTAVLTVVGILVNPAVLFLALMFAVSTYVMYYHLSGKMAANLYERVERRAATQSRGSRRGGFGAGPREEWTPPRDGRRADGFGRRAQQARQQQRRQRTQQRQHRRVRQSSGPSPSEAYDRLGLDPSADEQAVKQAYRERVKEVHPDTDTGSEAEFKRVKAAYERLTDD
nr:J domain-containing protein [Halomicroarcula pellucida]